MPGARVSMAGEAYRACKTRGVDHALLDGGPRRESASCPTTRAWRCTTPGSTAAALGPLLEIGTYCGKSAIYLGAAARERRARVAVHRRPPPRLGGEPGRVGAPRRAARRPAHRPHGHAAVLPAHDRGRRARGRRRRGDRRARRRSPRTGRRRSGSCSSTAVTRSTSRSPTTRAGRATSCRAALLVFHDVFEDPADGGQAPVRGVAARGRRRLHARLDHRQPPRPRAAA